MEALQRACFFHHYSMKLAHSPHSLATPLSFRRKNERRNKKPIPGQLSAGEAIPPSPYPRAGQIACR